MAPGLITTNVLHLESDIGTCQIELCVGDITKLQPEDKVDVLVVSAFPGDYTPTPYSLIGQLQIKLGISVEDLSEDKEEDLRKQYFCWWSKPLPDNLSYRRVLCFEGGFPATSPPRVIGRIFMCLVPILKNTEGSVVMPLITTGDQGYPKQLVLEQILKAAVNWIEAGLPLRTLKIVAFSTYPDKENHAFQPLFDLFENYCVVEKEPEQESFKEEDAGNSYNIFISHCHTDNSTAIKLKDYLEEKGLRVSNNIQEVNNKESWQDGIYKTLVKCSWIVLLLSPDYLASESCREQYNMALLISSRMDTKVIAIGEQSANLPTYVGQIHFQFGDFRPNDETKLKETADTIYRQLLITHKTMHRNDVQAAIEESQPPTTAFKNLALSNKVDIPYSVQVAEEKGSHQATEVKEERHESSRLVRGSATNRTGQNVENAKTPTEQDETP